MACPPIIQDTKTRRARNKIRLIAISGSGTNSRWRGGIITFVLPDTAVGAYQPES
jgi:hypothetical protein